MRMINAAKKLHHMAPSDVVRNSNSVVPRIVIFVDSI